LAFALVADIHPDLIASHAADAAGDDLVVLEILFLGRQPVFAPDGVERGIQLCLELVFGWVKLTEQVAIHHVRTFLVHPGKMGAL
jgi:hypothetical protein